MSRIRHIETPIAVRSLALTLPDGHQLTGHTHPWGQLVYATTGVLTVRAGGGSWVIPTHRAAWVPQSTAHSIVTTGRVRMRTLYLRSDVARTLPERCCAMSVSPLLREIVLAVVRQGMLRDDIDEQWRLAQVLVDQLVQTSEVPLELVWPRDPRAARAAELITTSLAERRMLRDCVADSGASLRTIERLFVKETGTTLAQWRQQAQLLAALRSLAAGESVTATALQVGFASTSAFVAMFRRMLGTTPGRYFDSDVAGQPSDLV